MESLTDAQRALFAAGGCLDDYDVLKPIGKGKFSVVYKAVRKRDVKQVALKKIAIFDMMDAKAREKTLKEVRLVQSVSHANIIEYLDAFIANNELHIVFEWAEAGDLKRQIRKANEKGVRFDERTIWRYFAQLCAAILHMHQARIMHRDLKPANIFLTLQGVVKVGDLGLGRHLSENTMEVHSKVGTPLYMSPEVLRGEGYDWKSDVWSLGCILYELAMLRSPFKSEGLNLYGLFQKINKGDYEPISAVYSDHLRGLVTRMISLTAADRPSVEEVWSMCQTRPSSAVLAEKRERIQAAQTVSAVKQKAQASHAGVAQKNERAAAGVVTTAATTAGVQVVRRKKTMRAQDARPPSPSSAAAASLSQQQEQRQQSQEERSSSSFRPPSSSQRSTSRARPSSASLSSPEGPTPEDTKQRHAEARMELLFERLKLLQYDRAVLKRVTCKHFLGDDRSLAQVSAHTRFADLCAFVTWLLKMLGVDVAPELDDIAAHSPVTVAQVLLLGAERAGVGPSVAHISAPALTSGGGDDVCVLLDALSVKALETRASRGSVLKRPSYPAESVDEMEAQDHLEIGADDEITDSAVGAGRGGSGDADWGDSTASTPDAGDDDMFAHWLVVKHERPATRRDSDDSEWRAREMIHARVDPAAWRRELARVAPTLRDRVAMSVQQTRAKNASWHARIEMLGRNVALIAAAAPHVRREIVQAQQMQQGETQRIAGSETRLNEQLLSARRRYHTHATALKAAREHAQSSQERVQASSVALTQLQSKLAATTSDVARESARVIDNSALVALKRQLRQLEDENQQLATQVEVLRYYLSQKQQLQQTQQRAAAGVRSRR